MVGPEFGISTLIDILTQEAIDERNSKPSTYMPLRPSSAGKCAKELAFEYTEYKGYAAFEKQPITPEVHRLLNLGHSIEYHVIKEMREAFSRLKKPVQIKYQQQAVSMFRLHDGTLIEGNIDLVLISDKFKMIADVKSKGSKYSSWAKSTWEEFVEKMSRLPSVEVKEEDFLYIDDLDAFLKANPDHFFNNNLYQLNLYATTDFILERGIDCAAIFQYDKSTSKIREIRFRPSKTVAQLVEEKFKRVAQVVDAEKSPEGIERDYALGSSKCAFCNFRAACHPEHDALKKYFKSLPPKRWPKDLNRLEESAQEKLGKLFNDYRGSQLAADLAEKVELDIVKELDKLNIDKIKLDDGAVFEVKRLKSGGVGGGPRAVLRRGKL